MSPEAKALLAGLDDRARRNADAVRDLARLDGPALLWRPRPESWGVADCLEHLVKAAEVYHPWLRAALAASPGESRAYKRSLTGRMMLHMAGPELPMRLEAPRQFAPHGASPDAPARFLVRQNELRVLIASAAGRDLNRPRRPSPLTRFLTLSPGEALEILVGHQERHLDQAQQVREARGFPDKAREVITALGVTLSLVWPGSGGPVAEASAAGSVLPAWVLFAAYGVLFLASYLYHRRHRGGGAPPPDSPGRAPVKPWPEPTGPGIWPRDPWGDDLCAADAGSGPLPA